MSITASFLLIFFSCLSMHTCKARYLRVMDEKAPAPQRKLLFSTKALENVELSRVDHIPVHEGSSGDNISHHATATVVKPEASENFLKGMKRNREMSSVPVPIKPLVSVSGQLPGKNYDERSANFKPSSHVGLLRATSIEGSRRRGLSVVEHGFHVKEGRNKANEEDATTTDYDPPHQKPPIHNRET